MSPKNDRNQANDTPQGGEVDSGPPPSFYRRPVLKISGEMLAGDQRVGLSRDVLRDLASQLAGVRKQGIEMALVVGAGNIFRGARNVFSEIRQTTADDMGMLGTLINSLALAEYIGAEGVPATVLSAVEAPKIAERFTVRRARALLDEGQLLLLAGGTGNPFFTTDTAAALRACELDADVLLKATNVDGVYSADPGRNPDATRYDRLDYQTVLRENLGVMDAAAVALCRQAAIPIFVFNLGRPGEIQKAIRGEALGTLVGGDR